MSNGSGILPSMKKSSIRPKAPKPKVAAIQVIKVTAAKSKINLIKSKDPAKPVDPRCISMGGRGPKSSSLAVSVNPVVKSSKNNKTSIRQRSGVLNTKVTSVALKRSDNKTVNRPTSGEVFPLYKGAGLVCVRSRLEAFGALSRYAGGQPLYWPP